MDQGTSVRVCTYFNMYTYVHIYVFVQVYLYVNWNSGMKVIIVLELKSV